MVSCMKLFYTKKKLRFSIPKFMILTDIKKLYTNLCSMAHRLKTYSLQLSPNHMKAETKAPEMSYDFVAKYSRTSI